VNTTVYFRNSVLVRRPYLKEEWIQSVLASPLRVVVQSNGRRRFWGHVAEIDRYLRVVTEPDGETVHNAFLDRRFRP